ncbi:hypothetical protein M885DRAFT_610556 [Pelagophyceae sp. CCMP2097]|nr:hypothetical protein M885DRAFT_610556 [Pelagophyceae sp. CCMP2097]|mmetsp:Transcript_9300/g.32635  ORF Transcript_9300/g.32635 Transcript_9300/m.32635 type:complete len:206 (+) Transcript_9300:54-671(+)
MRVLALMSLLVAQASALQAPRRAVAPARRRVEVASTTAEVSIAASQQLLALAAVAVGEGAWASTYNGLKVGKVARYLGPAVVVAGVLIAASESVGSGEAVSMTPGLYASTAACAALVASYAIRLGTEDVAAPPKEIVGFIAVLAFFGFSTAFQSLFVSGILVLPELPELPTFANVNDNASTDKLLLPKEFPSLSSGEAPDGNPFL